MEIYKIFTKNVTLLLAAMVLFVAPCAATATAADNEAPAQIFPTAENNPLAIVKEGFFSGVARGRVSLQNMKNYRVTSYRLEDDYLIFHEDKTITLDHVPPSSIIKLIMVEGQVLEIIVLQRSS